MKYLKIFLWSLFIVGALAAFTSSTAIYWFPSQGGNPPMGPFLQMVVIILLPVALIILGPIGWLAGKLECLLGITFSPGIALPITIILGAGSITLFFYLFDEKKHDHKVLMAIGVPIVIALILLSYLPDVLINRFERNIQPNTSWVKNKFNIYFAKENKFFSINIDGSERKEILTTDVDIMEYFFSPDGKFILVQTFNNRFYLVGIGEESNAVKLELPMNVEWVGWLRYGSGVVFAYQNELTYWGDEAEAYPTYSKPKQQKTFIYKTDKKQMIEREEPLGWDAIIAKKYQSGGQWPASSTRGEIVNFRPVILPRYAQIFYRDQNGVEKNLFILPTREGWAKGGPDPFYSVRWIPNSDYLIIKYFYKHKTATLIIDPQNGQIGQLTDVREYGWAGI